MTALFFSPGLYIRVPLGGLIDRSDKVKTAPLMLNTRNYLRSTFVAIYTRHVVTQELEFEITLLERFFGSRVQKSNIYNNVAVISLFVADYSFPSFPSRKNGTRKTWTANQ